MTRRFTGGFQPEGPASPPPSIPSKGVVIRTAAIGTANPLRSLGATYARQALATVREKVERHREERLADDREIHPGVFQRKDTQGHKPDYLACMDCRQADPMMFWVEDDVWQAAGLSRGIICLPCFETRLGRKLVIQDFKPVPMNDAIFTGYLMGIIQ